MTGKALYQSTRSSQITASPAEAVLQGIAPDGGLYTLSSYESYRPDLRLLFSMGTIEMAAHLLSLLLPDIPYNEMLPLLQTAYQGKFETDELTPLVPTGGDAILELFHGPTSAFKDVALSVLPRLMRACMDKCGIKDEILILTATSGDTGKAALSGFRDVPGTRIIVFYPDHGVSTVQQAQMTTQTGSNVCVCAVRGNFDDTQSGVKQIFGNPEAVSVLRKNGLRLSSANSINIGRLAPQVVYYFTAYREMLRLGRIHMGDPLDYAVPTGNFGDILAGFIARQMGLPVGRLVCASNENRVLTDFIRTGLYDRSRPFHLTLSPSMDILISSNLERLLYLLSGSTDLTTGLMASLAQKGHYQIPAGLLQKLQQYFWADFCDDSNTLRTIGQVWHDHHYLCDTHTAVAWHVAQKYKKACPGHAPVVILSTASPYKFPGAVLKALGQEPPKNGFDAMEQLLSNTGIPIPPDLASLRSRPIRHHDVIDKNHMQEYVLQKAVQHPWNP